MTIALVFPAAGTGPEAVPPGSEQRSTRRPHDEVEPPLVSRVSQLMGGTVGVHLRPTDGGKTAAASARRAADATLRRLGAWADRLTRFTTTSDLARLNSSSEVRVPIRATLAAVLDWSRQAEGLSDGIVDVTLLDDRLAAENAAPSEAIGTRPDRTWSIERGPRGSHVRRTTGLRIDLDGVAKGWLADRALGRLDAFPAAVVDADGDIAIRLGRGQRWRIGVTDPRATEDDLVVLDLVGSDQGGGRRFGLATSGTSVHRWAHAGGTAHHLIDPRTGAPARTDVVQATVLARSAREAETLAKTAVIVGSDAALDILDRPGVDGAILLTERDELLLTPSTFRWIR